MVDHSYDIAIIGSSGFIGRHLVNKLTNDKECHLRLLQHKTLSTLEGDDQKVKIIHGDLFNLDSLKELITESSTVINLVYLPNVTPEKNIEAISNIAEACIEKKAKRLIHCSTAVVCGRVQNDFITEEVPSAPFDEYEMTKLAIEKKLIETIQTSNLELAIVRPTCVFGEYGKNLLMLINNLKEGNRAINYLKSCLYNKRTMNLVSVHRVVSAINFLTKYQHPLKNQVFIVADDEDPNNNFRYVEKKLMNNLGIKDYFFPRLTCPAPLLSLILRIANKSNTNPNRRFKSDKLKKLGWSAENVFSTEIENFATSNTNKK